MKSWNEIRKAATAFSKRWKNAYDEKAQAQSFLKEFFAVFGVDAVTVATFEHRVKFADGSQGYADCFWPGTILVEMKSAGKDLDSAYQQAMEYVRSLAAKNAENTRGENDSLRSLRSLRQKHLDGSSLPRAIVVEASTVHLRAASLPVGTSFSLPYRCFAFVIFLFSAQGTSSPSGE